MTKAEFQKRMDALNNWAHHGCGNHGCRIESPKGMGTNSTCQCDPREFARALFELAVELESQHPRYGMGSRFAEPPTNRPTAPGS